MVRRLRHARSPADSATGFSWTNRASRVSRRIHRLLRVPPTGSSAATFTRRLGIVPTVAWRGIRPLVLTRPSGPGAHHPIAYAPGLYGIGVIREGLPMSREPALLGHRSVSADWSSQAGCRSAVSIERAEAMDGRSERPATGHGQPRTVASSRTPRVSNRRSVARTRSLSTSSRGGRARSGARLLRFGRSARCRWSRSPPPPRSACGG